MKTRSGNLMIAGARTIPGLIVLMIGIGAFAQDQSAVLTFIDHTNNAVIFSNTVTGSNWTRKISRPPTSTPPFAYKDAEKGIIFYVESDGHHISAISPDGRILWHRQPATDGNLPPYSEKHPRPNPTVVWIGALSKAEGERLKHTGNGRFIGISFNSRQSGVLDVKNGDFIFEGQD